MAKVTKRGGSQARATKASTKGTKSIGTKKAIKAAPRRAAVGDGYTIKVSAKLMKNLTNAAQSAGFKKVEKFVTPHLEKLANT